MAQGGKRRGAGRKRGPQPMTSMTTKISNHGRAVADQLYGLDTASVAKRLEELALSTEVDPMVSLGAASLLLRHTAPLPAMQEERANLDLGPLDTLEGLTRAVEEVTRLAMAGAIPTRQCREVSKMLELRLLCFEHHEHAQKITELEGRLRQLNSGQRCYPALSNTYRVGSAVSADHIDYQRLD